MRSSEASRRVCDRKKTNNTATVVLLAVVLASLVALGTARPAETQSGPYAMVVDNAQTNRFTAPEAWRESRALASQSQGESYAFASPGRGSAAFRVNLPRTGSYAVFARWPARAGHNASTPIGVLTPSGVQWTRVNQQKSGNRWVRLGVFRMAAGDRYNVFVSRNGRGSGRVVADAVRVVEVNPARHPDSILGRPIHSQATVTSYARSKGATKYILQTIPHYYDLAPRVGIAPDVLVAQAMVETGYGRYGGDSRPWNMAGVKKRSATGDTPQDFERPPNAYEGVRMHVNHMAAYTNRGTIGTPHGRYYVARDVQRSKGFWVSRISQLGGGTWATDPAYSGKIRGILDDMS